MPRSKKKNKKKTKRQNRKAIEKKKTVKKNKCIGGAIAFSNNPQRIQQLAMLKQQMCETFIKNATISKIKEYEEKKGFNENAFSVIEKYTQKLTPPTDPLDQVLLNAFAPIINLGREFQNQTGIDYLDILQNLMEAIDVFRFMMCMLMGDGANPNVDKTLEQGRILYGNLLNQEYPLNDTKTLAEYIVDDFGLPENCVNSNINKMSIQQRFIANYVLNEAEPNAWVTNMSAIFDTILGQGTCQNYINEFEQDRNNFIQIYCDAGAEAVATITPQQAEALKNMDPATRKAQLQNLPAAVKIYTAFQQLNAKYPVPSLGNPNGTADELGESTSEFCISTLRWKVTNNRQCAGESAADLLAEYMELW